MNNNQRGFSNIWVVGAVAAVVILAVIGYLVSRKRTGGSGGVPAGLGVSEKDFDFIDDANVRKHFATQLNQSTYEYKSISSGRGVLTTYQFQTRGQDYNYRTLEHDGGKELSDLINVGETIYVKDYSDNKYWRQTLQPEEIKQGDEAEFQDPQNLESEFKKPNVTYKFLGKEACGNLTCFKYEESDPTSQSGTRTFWFDDKKYLLRKEAFMFGEFSLTNDYNYEGISVKAPSQTKEVPAGKNVYDYYYPGGVQPTGQSAQPSSAEVEKLQQQLNVTPESLDSEDTSDY